MDLCAGLLAFALVVVLVALVGHGLWLVVAWFGRALFASPMESEPRAAGRPRQRLCVRCGCGFSRALEACPQCGLDPTGPIAEELRELETTVHYLQRLVDQGALEPGAGEQVYRGLEARQTTLLDTSEARRANDRPDAVPIPMLQPRHWDRAGAVPLLQRLEQLLNIVADVRDLSLANRQLALSWYKQLPQEALPRLPAQALLGLARLTRTAGLSSRSLYLYDLVVQLFPEAPQAPLAALEAAELAFREGKHHLARHLLDQVFTYAISDEQYQIAHRLQDRLELTPASAAPPILLEAPPIPVAVAVMEEDPIPSLPPPLPLDPQRTWGQLLGGFMEEKNILWGELVGGLLIVGCSIALVISLWRTLEAIPYFPFLIFAAITGALFGAGLYTLSHWKLEATSRGLLVIATLLTPLDFLVLTGLWRVQDAGLLDWGLAVGTLLFFTWLVARSGRVLVQPLILGWRRADWLLALGVVGVSACMLPAPAWLENGEPAAWILLVLSYGPILCAGLAIGVALTGWRVNTPGADRAAEAVFLLLGQTFFALGVTWGLLLYSSGDLGAALHGLAGPVALAGLPLLATGTLVQKRLDPSSFATPATERGLPLGLARWLGTVLVLVGMGVLLGGTGLAWPSVAGLVVLGLLSALVLFTYALRGRQSYAHVPALACLGLVLLTSYHGWFGERPVDEIGTWFWHRFTSPASTTPLTIFALLLAVSSEGLARQGRRIDALIHLVIGGMVGGFALLLVGMTGIAAPGRATLAFASLGLAVLIVNGRWRQAEASYGGGVLLLLALAFGLAWYAPETSPTRAWVYALLSYATVALGAGFYFTARGDKSQEEGLAHSHGQPLLALAFGATLLALIPLALALSWSWLPTATSCAVWLAGLWLTLAWMNRSPFLATTAQAMLMVAVVLATSSWLGQQAWVQQRVFGLVHPWSLQFYGLSLAIFCVGWLLAKRAGQRFAFVQELYPTESVLLEGATLALLLVGSIILTLPSLAQGIAVELSPPGNAAPFAVPLDASLAWGLWAVLAAALGFGLWTRIAGLATVGLVVLALGGVLIGGDQFHDQKATASALRWGLALAFVLLSILVWQRKRLALLGGQCGIDVAERSQASDWCRRLLVMGAFMPVLCLTVGSLYLRVSGWRPAGPDPESVFGQLGSLWSRTIPLAILAGGLLGYAWREKMAGYFFATGLLLVALVSGGRALLAFLSGEVIDEVFGVFVFQLGLIAAGTWTLLWLASGRWREAVYLVVQVGLGTALTFAALAPVFLEIVLDPDSPLSAASAQAGRWSGWLAFALNCTAGVWYLRQMSLSFAIHLLAAIGVGAGVLAAATVSGGSSAAWAGLDLLTVLWTLLALGLLAASWLGDASSALGPKFWPAERRTAFAAALKNWLPATPTRRWVECLGLVVVLLAFRGVWQAPTRPVLALATLMAVSILLGALAVWARRPGYVYASGLLLSLFAFVLWQAWTATELGELFWWPWRPFFVQRFMFLQIVALGLGAAAWSIVDGRLRRLTVPVDVRGAIIPYPHAAALAAIHLLALLVVASVACQVFGLAPTLSQPLAWVAWLAVATAVAWSAWDAEASLWGLPGAPAFLLGLLAIGLLLHDLRLSEVDVAWSGALLVAAYLALSAAAARWQPRLAGLTDWLRLPSRAGARAQFWFVPAQALLGAGVLVISLGVCLGLDQLGQRLTGPAAVSLLVLSALTLASAWPQLMGEHPAQPLRRTKWPRTVALWLIVVTLVEAAWAVQGPNWSALWLHRAVALLAVLVLATGVYGTGVMGRFPLKSEWGYRCLRVARPLAVASLLQLALVLTLEFSWYDPVARRAPLHWLEVTLVAVLLLAAMAGALWLAVSPRFQRWGWSESKRGVLVYGAEGLLVLLLVHFRLCVPDFLPGFVSQNWAFAVMVLAFGGVGLAEWFRRKGLTVLAQPLERTGLFLPLFPLAAYLAKPLSVFEPNVWPGLQPFLRSLERLPGHFSRHALLWFLLGLLYTWVALLRRSTVWALLAALAANFGLWVLLAHEEGLGFLLHPQLWLVPLGLIILAAEHLQRQALTPVQSKTIRYAGLLVVYLSSTADMFITGLGQSWWLPLVLALLAVAGVFAGILLRVRAFLVLGIAFLFLVIFAQIWHAAVDRTHTWLWWVCGIVLGAAILVVFALFEKRKNEVVKVFEELKRWE